MLKRLAVVVGVVFVAAIAVWCSSASARWKPEYAQLPQATRDWYRDAELTEAAKKRFNFTKCCDQSDVVKTKFKVGGTGGDQWWWLNDNKWQRIPDDVIHWGVSAPGGLPTLFVLGGQPTCFFPGEGGL